MRVEPGHYMLWSVTVYNKTFPVNAILAARTIPDKRQYYTMQVSR